MCCPLERTEEKFLRIVRYYPSVRLNVCVKLQNATDILAKIKTDYIMHELTCLNISVSV
jgi:hypothetical protein